MSSTTPSEKLVFSRQERLFNQDKINQEILRI